MRIQPHLLSKSIGLAFILSASSLLQAQEVLEMPNSERLSGSVIKTESGIIYFKNDYLGVVEIPVFEAKVLTEAEIAAAEAAAAAAEAEAVEESIAPLIAGSESWFVWDSKPASWSGDIKMGYNLKSAQVDSSSLILDGTLNIDPEDRPYDHYKLGAFYHYGEQDDVKDTDEYGAFHRYRRDTNERSFFQSLTRYESNRIKKIRHQASQAFGFGYKFIDTEEMVFDITVGPSIQYLDQPGDVDGIDYLGEFYESFMWHILPGLNFYQSFTYNMSFTDSENYNCNLYAALETALFGPFSVFISYKLDYDNPVPSDIEKTETLLTTSIGYVF